MTFFKRYTLFPFSNSLKIFKASPSSLLWHVNFSSETIFTNNSENNSGTFIKIFSSSSPFKNAVVIFNWCITNPFSTANANNSRTEFIRATGANVSLKSTPGRCANPFATRQAFCFSMAPFSSYLLDKTILQPVTLHFAG